LSPTLPRWPRNTAQRLRFSIGARGWSTSDARAGGRYGSDGRRQFMPNELRRYSAQLDRASAQRSKKTPLSDRRRRLKPHQGSIKKSA
jgi:hypothetical protein